MICPAPQQGRGDTVSHLPCSNRAPQVSGRPWPAGLLGRFPGGLLLRLQHATPVVVHNATDGWNRQPRCQQIKSLKARNSNQMVLKEQRELPAHPDQWMRDCDSGYETHHRQQVRWSGEAIGCTEGRGMADAGDVVLHVLHERHQQPPSIELNRGSRKENSGTKRGHKSCTVAWVAIHNTWCRSRRVRPVRGPPRTTRPWC
jgi:hypothetical protein